MFGRANITIPLDTTTYIAGVDNIISLYHSDLIEHLSAVQDQDCLNYGLFLFCLAIFSPCPGSAWCGANSKDELRSAVTSACRCNNRDDSCVVNLNGAIGTAEAILIRIIHASIPKYYVGSSSTGPVGDSNAVCQDATGKRHNLHACSLHCVAVELVMFIYCVVVVYLTFSLISHMHSLVTQIYLGPHAHDVLPCSSSCYCSQLCWQHEGISDKHCSGGHFVLHWTEVAVGNHPVDEQQLRTVCVVRARTCSGLW